MSMAAGSDTVTQGTAQAWLVSLACPLTRPSRPPVRLVLSFRERFKLRQIFYQVRPALFYRVECLR